MAREFVVQSLKQPRVLFVGAFPPLGTKIYGGMVTSCRALLKSSFASRVELDLVDSTQIAHPPPRLPTRLILASYRLLTFIVQLERKRPSAVILLIAAGASVAEKGVMAWYARMRRVPALMFPRGGPVIDACRASRFTRAWTRFAFRGGRVVLCQGPAWREFAINTLGFDAPECPIVPNWTATDDLLAIGQTRTPRNGKLALLFVGWLDKEKGVVELLDACKALAATHRFTLTLVGEGNRSEYARNFVAENGLSGLVSFRGWLDGPELVSAYAEADIFVLPSWSEGLPNAMIEAMAAGLPVVVSAVGNIPDAIADGTSGLLVPPRNGLLLRAAIQRLLESPRLRTHLSLNAHALARERFGVENAVDKLMSAITHAVRVAEDHRLHRTKGAI